MSVIADFLVRLGYDLDEGSEKKVEQSTEEVKGKFERISESIIGIKEAIVAIATGAVIGKLVGYVTEAADKFEALNDLTGQLGSKDAEDVASLQYAFTQMGAEVDTVNDSLLNLTDIVGQAKLGEGEGVEVFKKLGIDIKDANGNAKDSVTIFNELNDKLSKVDQATRVAYINMLGLDTELAKGMGENAEQLKQFQQQYRDMYSNAGVDIDKAAEEAKAFNQAIRSLEATFQSIKDAVGVAFLGAGAQTFEQLRKILEDNTKKMITVVKGFLDVVMSISRAFFAVGKVVLEAISSIITWWEEADTTLKTTIKVIGGITAAIVLMNTAFMKSPIGRLLAIVAVIGTLIDDFQIWKEGGNSVIGELLGGFDELMARLDSFKSNFEGTIPILGDIIPYIKSAIGNTDKLLIGLVGLPLAFKTAGSVIPGFNSLLTLLFRGTFGLGLSTIGKTITMFGSLGAKILVFSSGVIPKLISVIGLLSKSFITFGLSLMATPIGWIILGITALIAAGVALYKNWDTIVEFIGNAWDSLVEFISGSIDTVKSVFKSIGDFLLSLPDIIFAPWAKLFDWLASKFEWISDAKDGLVGAADSVKSFFGFGDDEEDEESTTKADSGGWFSGLFGDEETNASNHESGYSSLNASTNATSSPLQRMVDNSQANLNAPAVYSPSNQPASSQVSVTQSNGDTNIVIQAAENPQATAEAVANQQQQVQSNAARNLRRNFA